MPSHVDRKQKEPRRQNCKLRKPAEEPEAAPEGGARLSPSGSQGTLATPLPHLDLTDVVGGDEDADANGDEDEADDEEGRQHRAGREDGLPGGQPLLFEGRVIRPPGLGGAPGRTRGPAVHLILRVIVHCPRPLGFGSATSSWAAQGTSLPTLPGAVAATASSARTATGKTEEAGRATADRL